MTIRFLYFKETTSQPKNVSRKIRTFYYYTYLFLVFYRSTTLQSRSFLKNINNFLCKQKLVNNRSIPLRQQPQNHDTFSKIQLQSFLKNIESYLCKYKIVNNRSIPSTHAVRNSPYLSDTLALHGLEELFFQLCCCVSFWFWREIGFGFTYLRTLLNNFLELMFS